MEMICAKAGKERKTIVIVTHDNRIFRYADRIVELKMDKYVTGEKKHV